MSALSVLYLVLPFVGVFAVHEIEELATASRWAERIREKRLGLSPVSWFFLGRFSEADRKELWVTAIEEMLLLVVITGYLQPVQPNPNWSGWRLCWLIQFIRWLTLSGQ